MPLSVFASSLLKIVASDVFRAAVVAFLLAFTLSILARNSWVQVDLSSIWNGIQSQMTNIWKLAKGRAGLLLDALRPKRDGVPMTFDVAENDGWGVCTLRSKKRLGKTSFVQYDFDLPKSNNVLPLKLGQQISFCCLDESGNVAKGEFYPYILGKPKLGTFSILAPDRTLEDSQFSIGADSANFVSEGVLKTHTYAMVWKCFDH